NGRLYGLPGIGGVQPTNGRLYGLSGIGGVQPTNGRLYGLPGIGGVQPTNGRLYGLSGIGRMQPTNGRLYGSVEPTVGRLLVRGCRYQRNRRVANASLNRACTARACASGR
ncbi:hypothetical protein KQ945_13075, partial [Bacillus subtilis subsp. subtilis]|nr:hypothetical protein [Bacillus subtilis subsp. subtilis]